MEKSRVELFELDWSKPMTHLSKELNVCKKINDLTDDRHSSNGYYTNQRKTYM